VVDQQPRRRVDPGGEARRLHLGEQRLERLGLSPRGRQQGLDDAAVGGRDPRRQPERQRRLRRVGEDDEDARADPLSDAVRGRTLATERSTSSVPATIETRIRTSAALTTDWSKRPMLKPTIVAARVAAACGTVSPSINVACGPL
jgi:hypothetical protein